MDFINPNVIDEDDIQITGFEPVRWSISRKAIWVDEARCIVDTVSQLIPL